MTAASAAAAPTVALLPVSPRPLPGEALSSWIARVAARYDLGAAVFLRQVLRDDGVDSDTEEAGRQARRLDALPWPAAEVALARATRLDRMVVRPVHHPGDARRHRDAVAAPVRIVASPGDGRTAANRPCASCRVRGLRPEGEPTDAGPSRRPGPEVLAPGDLAHGARAEQVAH